MAMEELVRLSPVTESKEAGGGVRGRCRGSTSGRYLDDVQGNQMSVDVDTYRGHL